MTKLLTVKRSIFFGVFLALALVGTAFQQRVPTVRGKEKTPTHLRAGDRAYAEGNIIFSVRSGKYDGSAVTFHLARSASAATPIVQDAQTWDGTIPESINPDDYAGVDPYSADPNAYGYDSSTYGDYSVNLEAYNSCAESMVNAGAANQTTLTIATAGHSLPLKADTYLPITLRGKLEGHDVAVDTIWTGTVLAHAGFSADNPDIEMPQSSVAYGGAAGGVQTMNASGSNGGFNSIQFKKWKSNVPSTEDINALAFTVETSGIQYDAASATLNVKQKLHLKRNLVKKGTAAE